jgi:hypothetical protein
MDAETECAQALVLAVFRLAVADYLGLSYGHDGPDRSRAVAHRFRFEAGAFLDSAWAGHLADCAGFSAVAVRSQAELHRQPSPAGAVSDIALTDPKEYPTGSKEAA